MERTDPVTRVIGPRRRGLGAVDHLEFVTQAALEMVLRRARVERGDASATAEQRTAIPVDVLGLHLHSAALNGLVGGFEHVVRVARIGLVISGHAEDVAVGTNQQGGIGGRAVTVREIVDVVDRIAGCSFHEFIYIP